MDPFMILAVKEERYKAVEVNFNFPFFRQFTVSENHHHIYYKIESVGKISRLEERGSGIMLDTLDAQEDYLRDVASVDMFDGTNGWSIIEESVFDKILYKLIDKINKV